MGEVNNYLDIYEQIDPTNKEIYITYSPDNSTIKYEYRIIKNGKVGEYISVNNKKQATILLDKTGKYQLEFRAFDYYGNVTPYDSGIYNIDMDSPTIKIDEKFITMPKGSKLIVLEGVYAYDKQDGDLSNKITTNYDELDFNSLGMKKLTYTVSDSAGNIVTEYININVIRDNTFSLLLLQVSIITLLVMAFAFVIRFIKTLRYEKRIVNYSIEPVKNSGLSIFDKLSKIHQKLIDRISKDLSNSVFIKRYSQKYDKYSNIVSNSYHEGLNFIASKIIIACAFAIIAIFVNTLQGKLLGLYEFIVPMIAGFIMPNILYIYQYKTYLNKMENDLLQAITIMNNAFKSGRSIIQAIDLVTKELDGPMAKEFEKMYLEMNLGLSIDIVFKRFEERLKIEEVTYLTASLSILNQTGGNITKVFSSIEKTLFNKKKLKLELNSLTGVSKIIVYILIAVPVLFVFFVALINPDYFMPLLTNNLGRIITFIMIIIYICYIYVVNKIMKVRM